MRNASACTARRSVGLEAAIVSSGTSASVTWMSSAELGEAMEVGGDRVGALARRVEDVALEADAVDRHPAGDATTRRARTALGTRVVNLGIDLVQIQAGVGVGLVGEAKGELDVVGTDHVVPGAVAIGAVGLDRLVDDVPLGDPAAIARDQRRDVSAHHVDQLGPRPAAGGDPARHERPPDERVPASLHPCVVAKSTTWSAPPNANWPRAGSTIEYCRSWPTVSESRCAGEQVAVRHVGLKVGSDRGAADRHLVCGSPI